jgi:hypothetical protein
MDKSIEHLYPSTENTSSKSPWVYNYNFGVPQFYNRSCCCCVYIIDLVVVYAQDLFFDGHTYQGSTGLLCSWEKI